VVQLCHDIIKQTYCIIFREVLNLNVDPQLLAVKMDISFNTVQHSGSYVSDNLNTTINRLSCGTYFVPKMYYFQDWCRAILCHYPLLQLIAASYHRGIGRSPPPKI